MNIKLIAGVVAILVAGVAVYSWWSPNTVTRNIRVIAKAEVDGKIVEGSAVMGLRWQAGDKGRMYIKTNTEAVILDLDGRGTVYVLNVYMSPNGLSNIGYWQHQVLGTFGMKGNGQLTDFTKLKSVQGRYQVKPLVGSPPQLPLMVAFKDETKRETMFEVKPRDFSKVFGSDVRFAGLWFEFTDDPETDSIVGRLPVMTKVNKSFMAAFPSRDANGNLIPAAKWAFPEKLGKTAFFKRAY